ncbi:MAG: IS200/IS605 family transposase [Parachlamydiaceae bacterium]|nr:IS200/IS605 family transposase [Parachlamydiaceae bacterium]
MGQSLSDVVIHLIFSTKNREPIITDDIESELFRYICGRADQLKSSVIRINGMEDHIHILLHLSKEVTYSDLIADLKANSSRWIKSKGEKFQHFSWQSGYGAFSVSRSMVDRVIHYINNQKEHHKKYSFKEELLLMLKRAKIKYDEKYLWD